MYSWGARQGPTYSWGGRESSGSAAGHDEAGHERDAPEGKKKAKNLIPIHARAAVKGNLRAEPNCLRIVVNRSAANTRTRASGVRA